MRKLNEENERIKRQYLYHLKHAGRKNEKTLDKVMADLVTFEEGIKFKPFKKITIGDAERLKNHLSDAKNSRTGKPLSISTVDSTLRNIENFILWLAGEKGFKSKIKYSDANYYKNSLKNSRIAHAKRPIQFPSLDAAKVAFEKMPEVTEQENRDKAMFAFLMLTVARASAVTSFKLKHINLADGSVFQDGREVQTKLGKTFTTTFFPVDRIYLECFEKWVKYLREIRLFSPEDALFPRPEMELVDGKFAFTKLSRELYSNSRIVRSVVGNAFVNAGLPRYTPHSFRNTNVQLMARWGLTAEEEKAWSQNIGHTKLQTTVSSYLHVPEQRQAELLKRLKKKS